MDEYALIGTSSESTSKSVSLDGARRLALKHIEGFVLTFSDPQAFTAAASSSAPTALAQVTERARIQEAGHLRCRFTSLYIPNFRVPKLSLILRANGVELLRIRCTGIYYSELELHPFFG